MKRAFLRPPLFGRRRTSAKRGFTLVEVLCATVIFSIAAVALIESLGSATRVQADLEGRGRAAMLGENVLEEIVASGEFEPGIETGHFEGSDSRFAWATEIKETDHKKLYFVTARVRWSEGMSAREFTLSTYLADTDSLSDVEQP